MAKTWNPSLAIGIPLLDIQHEQLLDQMDRLLEAINTNKASTEIISIMEFLKMYVNNHFGYEESCMDLHKCVVACDNKNAHAKFIKSLKEINLLIDNKQPLDKISQRVKQELLDWFVNHIKMIDIQLKSSIK